MKIALVIQNSLRSLGGGELVCLSTCLALQNLGYRVKLASDRFKSDEIEAAFGMGDVLRRCEQLRVPEIGRKLARFSSIPGIYFARKSKGFYERQNADLVFVTRDPRRPEVLPSRPIFRFVYEIDQLRPYWENYSCGLRSVYRTLYGRDYHLTTFLALSSTVKNELQLQGHPRTELVYPSYGKGFRPRRKKNQIVYATFLAPQKQLDDFCEVAGHLPEYRFYLIGRDTARMNRIYKGYAERILSNKPSNVEYVEARIRQVPEFLEESKIYLHTSKEPGMNIAMMEAMSAGCIPIAPKKGGAGEPIDVSGVGFRYNTIQDAMRFIRSELSKNEGSKPGNGASLAPQAIADKARIFSPESFQNRIQDIIQKQHLTP